MSKINWLSRDWYIFRNYVISRQRKPFLASYKLTHACNLTCTQCPFRLQQMPVPSYKEVCTNLQKLYLAGARLIIFEGGEPLLWRDGQYTFQDVAAEANRLFFRTAITTNGTLPLDVPVDLIWVSIDGLHETHNRLRGGDVYDQILDNIARSSHPNIMAHITINAENYQEIQDLIRFLDGKVKGITIQFYYPYHHQYDLFLNPYLRAKLLDELILLKRSRFPILNSTASLKALKNNRWRCADWLLINANPDGTITQGCYLKGRDDIDCRLCGFSPHTEISLAYQGNISAILAGSQIFFSKT